MDEKEPSPVDPCKKLFTLKGFVQENEEFLK